MAQNTCRAAVVIAAIGFAAGARAGKTLSLDAREALLGDVVNLMVAQGAPRVAVPEEVASRKITFAAKGISPAAGLRWLCRSEKLEVVEGSSGRLGLVLPAKVPSVEKHYRLTKLALTKDAAAALKAFIERSIFRLYPHREKDEAGELAPRLEADCEPGKLTLVAPMMVQREVVALLNAMVAAGLRRGYKQVVVRYRPTELGFLAERDAGPAPKLQGKVKLEGGTCEAWEAAWRLTRAAGMSFYVDPWDDALVRSRANLREGETTVGAVVGELREQLGAELRWYDGAWVFCRQGRASLFGDYVVRAYNLSGTNSFVRPFVEAAVGLVRRRMAFSGVPTAIERVGENLWLVAAPSERHDPLEEFLNRPDGPSRRREWGDWRPGRRSGRRRP